MRTRKFVTVAFGCVALAASASAFAQGASPGLRQPRAGLTTGEAMAAFGQALLVSCLDSLEQGKPIADLNDQLRTDLVPATPEERNYVASRHPDATVWSSQALGSHLSVIEVSQQRCEIWADQLPVERTFQSVIGALTHVMPDFQAVPQKPGYNPIVYQYEADRDGAHYVIHMEGAEPGGFGHASRFSLLSAWVTRN